MYGTHRVDIRQTPATTHVFDIEKGLPFLSDFFDVVYERNLLEHLQNVGFHLEEVYRVLKSGGRLHLITDYAGCSRFYILRTHEGRYEQEHHSTPDDRHYSIFTKSHIRNHLEKIGFKNIQISLTTTERTTRFLDKLTRSKPRIKAEATK